jgi:putative membrane protein insertion efficiency factor
VNMTEKCRDRVYPCPNKDKEQTQLVGNGHPVRYPPSVTDEASVTNERRVLSLRYFAVFLIKIYQNTLGFVFPQACRFYPSCSEYSIQAFEKHGFFKGGWLSVRRLLRCHPFNPGGYDPVE